MGIVEIPPPASIAGRQARIPDADLEALADKVRAGSWVSETEGAHAKSCAYQRAQAIQKRLRTHYGINNLTTKAWPHPDHALEILDLEKQIEAIEADGEGTTVESEIEAFKAECGQLRIQILKLGGYLWGLGPRASRT